MSTQGILSITRTLATPTKDRRCAALLFDSLLKVLFTQVEIDLSLLAFVFVIASSLIGFLEVDHKV